MTNGQRVSPEVELEGLDVPEMGVVGYGGIVMDKQSETPMSKGYGPGKTSGKPSSMINA
jgi:Amt family ammonium transporter